MFETLQKATLDKIFVLMAEYAADPRTDKIDLGVGVYKDDKNNTPIMSAVKKAEQRMHDNAKTKTYMGVVGNKGFSSAVVQLVLDGKVDASRIRTVNGPGGTGALSILLNVLGRARPGGRIWMSDPTWPNHWPMAELVGLKPQYYPYFDAETRRIDFPAMLNTIDGLGPDDVVLLHACCHNPTGANLSPAQWDEVAASLKRTGAFPLIDLAYLGFGDGLEQDAYGVRKLATTLPESMIAFSGSKNFGLYRDRVGAAYAMAADPSLVGAIMSNGHTLARANWSMPPDHGASAVRMILRDAGMTKLWLDELDDMRARMRQVRDRLGAAGKVGTLDLTPCGMQNGLFSMLALTPEQILKLREEHGVYMAGSGRINIAGLTMGNIDKFIGALAAVTA